MDTSRSTGRSEPGYVFDTERTCNIDAVFPSLAPHLARLRKPHSRALAPAPRGRISLNMRIDPSPILDPRAAIRALTYADEGALVRELAAATRLEPRRRAAIAAEAAGLVREVRARSTPSVMEAFLAEYGLSTDEGVGLMCLAEALLRVPDAQTIDELIADKIEPSNWGAHLGRSSSSLVNAATWVSCSPAGCWTTTPRAPPPRCAASCAAWASPWCAPPSRRP
jgi:hypothetical protein